MSSIQSKIEFAARGQRDREGGCAQKQAAHARRAYRDAAAARRDQLGQAACKFRYISLHIVE